MTDTDSTRHALITGILDFLAAQDLLAHEEVRRVLEHEIDDAGPDALSALKARLTTDHGWDFYPRDPLAQRIHHLLADRFLDAGSHILGAHHFAAVSRSPLVLFSNHLSYADANVVEILLRRTGETGLSERLTAIAGPKVFTDRQRRFSSLCFGTIKVPQSAEVSSGEAILSARDVARAARRSIEVAHERLEAGDALLLFGEGTRSRDRRMQQILPAVSRYLDLPGTCVLPIGLVGPETLFPVEGAILQPTRVVMSVGPPLRADALLSYAARDRRVAVDAIGLAVAELLPVSYRGVYENVDVLGRAALALARARQAAAL